MSEVELISSLRNASDALEYLRGRTLPLIHLDNKPSNVIRRPDGSFVLIDFGSVRDSLKPEGGSTVVGTFGYAPGEDIGRLGERRQGFSCISYPLYAPGEDIGRLGEDMGAPGEDIGRPGYWASLPSGGLS